METYEKMIANQVKGTGFKGLLDYVLGKKDSELISSNMAGQTPRQLASEFQFSRQLNPNVKRAVYHVSLSLPYEEDLSNETWTKIAQDYLHKMNFTYNQYIVVRHRDNDYQHCHIVASRIRLDGTCVPDSWDYFRSLEVVRSLEKTYSLSSPYLPPHEEIRNLPSPQKIPYRQGTAEIKEIIQQAIDSSCLIAKTMPELIQSLDRQGIETQVQYTRTGQVRGISYKLDGIAFSGTHLGKAYTFPGLQKYQKVDYQSLRDDPFLHQYYFSKNSQLTSNKSTDLFSNQVILNNQEKSQSFCLE